MEKTIDERIQEKGYWYDEDNFCCVDYTSVVELIEEQRKLDIEKAIEWLKRELAEPMPDEIYQQWCDEKLTDFRKYMEG